MRRKEFTIGRKSETLNNVEHSFKPGQLYIQADLVILVTSVEHCEDTNLGLGGIVKVTCLCSFYGGKDTKVETYDLLSTPPPNSWWTKHKVQ